MSEVERPGKVTRCYVDEYLDASGRLSARLREKETGRKVDLGSATPRAKQDFLRFLSRIGAQKSVRSELFRKERTGSSVIVSGQVDFDSPDEIRYIFDEKLTYQVGLS